MKIVTPRALTDKEKDLLKNGPEGSAYRNQGGIFVYSLNYDKIRIKHASGDPKTLGDTIFLPDKVDGQDLFAPDGSLTGEGQKILFHEATHVWQNQNTNNSLLLEAKISWQNIIYTGRKDAQYEWRDDALNGIPFENLRVEQQARLIEDITSERGKLMYKNTNLAPYAADALAKLQKKQGAP